MKKIISLILALAICLSLAACGTPDNGENKNAGTGTPDVSQQPENKVNVDNNKTNAGEETGEAVYGGTVRIVNTCEGSSELGVPWTIMNADTNCITPCFESLLYETTGGEIEPCLATSWEVDVENCEVTFHLREGVKFHDGSDFNAESAAWNIQQMIETQRMKNGESCTVVDDYTICIKYKTWSYANLTGMYSASFAFMSMKQALEKGMDYAAEHPCGTGPFIYKEYNRGQKVTWVKNENYWQEGKPYLDSIEFVFMTDATTKMNAMQIPFEDGGIDILNISDAYQVSQLMELDSVFVNFVDIGPVALYPDSNDPDSPLSDLRVRQAISYAIDRDAICAARGYGIYKPALELVSPAWGCFLDDPEYQTSYDKEKALALLKEAGYEDGFTCKFYVQPNMFDKDVAVAIQAMLSEVGINLDIQFPESGGYTDLKMNGWDGMLGQMWRNLTDIITSFNLWFDVIYDEETGEYSHFWMPSAYRPYESLYKAEREAGNTAEPDDEKLAEVLKILMGEMLAIPVYYCYDAYVIRNEVHDSGYGAYSMLFKPAEIWKEK